MSRITFPDEFQLELQNYYFSRRDDPEAVDYCLAYEALFEKAKNGELYVKFIDGDRKGSIARVRLHPDYRQDSAQIVERYSRWDQDRPFEIVNQYMYVVARWDKRKNSCQLNLPNKDVVFLPNYRGPTVYQMFDKKAAKEELLKDPDLRDIDGKKLAVGDKVLYINARYGSGFVLCHGTIKEFKVSVDSSGHAFTTVVQNDQIENEVSSISCSFEMIWKK